MLGDIVQLANNLWLVVGDQPAETSIIFTYYFFGRKHQSTISFSYSNKEAYSLNLQTPSDQ